MNMIGYETSAPDMLKFKLFYQSSRNAVYSSYSKLLSEMIISTAIDKKKAKKLPKIIMVELMRNAFEEFNKKKLRRIELISKSQKLRISSIWGFSKNFDLEKNLKSNLVSNYDFEAKKMSFESSDEIVSHFEDYAKKEMKSRVPMVDLSTDSFSGFFTNFYFISKWNKKNTPTTQIRYEWKNTFQMSRKVFLGYKHVEIKSYLAPKFEIYQLKYEIKGFSLLIKKNYNSEQQERPFTFSNIKSFLRLSKISKVSLLIPLFEFDQSYNLMSESLNGNKNFLTKFLPRKGNYEKIVIENKSAVRYDFGVDSIIQRVKFAITSQGTESHKSLPTKDSINPENWVIFNNPFYFALIEDETGIILLEGHINNPN